VENNTMYLVLDCGNLPKTQRVYWFLLFYISQFPIQVFFFILICSLFFCLWFIVGELVLFDEEVDISGCWILPFVAFVHILNPQARSFSSQHRKKFL